MTEDEMVGWHHRLNGHEFEQAQGDGEGLRSLACCSPAAAAKSLQSCLTLCSDHVRLSSFFHKILLT